MPEPTQSERLQPALLDRLTDDEPQVKQEPREARLINRSRLRQAVLRDLSWLFNATRPATRGEFDGLPEVERSVLNFGLPALSGETASMLDVVGLERSIKQAILDFEPRIIPETLEVQAVVSDVALDHHNIVSLEIRGNMWAHPAPLELLLRTLVDLETGQVEIHAPSA
jgi:type VI secretion system protein ImpF